VPLFELLGGKVREKCQVYVPSMKFSRGPPPPLSPSPKRIADRTNSVIVGLVVIDPVTLKTQRKLQRPLKGNEWLTTVQKGEESTGFDLCEDECHGGRELA